MHRYIHTFLTPVITASHGQAFNGPATHGLRRRQGYGHDLKAIEAQRTGGAGDGFDDWRRNLLPAAEHGGQCQRRRHPDRLGDHRGGHADPGVRLPEPGQPQAGTRHRRVRLCQGRFRRLHGLLVRLGLLDQRLDRQRQLLRVAVQHPRLLRTDVRRGQHPAGGDRRLAGAVGRALPRPARYPRGGVRQPGHHHRQDRAVDPVHRDHRAGLPPGRVHRRLLGSRQPGAGQRHAAGAQHDAGDGVGVHRHRGRQRVLGPRRTPQRCRARHGHRLLQRARAAGAGEHPVDGHHEPGRAGGPEEPFHGGRAGAGGRSLGRGADQRRPGGFAGRCPVVLDPSVCRDSLRRRP